MSLGGLNTLKIIDPTPSDPRRLIRLKSMRIEKWVMRRPSPFRSTSNLVVHSDASGRCERLDSAVVTLDRNQEAMDIQEI
mgnify:CR=1 FL=1|jgi:hypothetical protein